jgi:hypothetical protein
MPTIECQGESMKQKAMPLQGPWYYVFLAPRWELFSSPSVDQDHSIGHAAFWARTVAPAIAEHYGLADKSSLKRLINIPYSMPRGRVCHRPRPRNPQEWVVYFGEDWPASLKTIAARESILKAFNLASADWLFDEHETRLDNDEFAFSAITAVSSLCHR